MRAVDAVIGKGFLRVGAEQPLGERVGEDDRRAVDDEVRGAGRRRGQSAGAGLSGGRHAKHGSRIRIYHIINVYILPWAERVDGRSAAHPSWPYLSGLK